MSKISQSPQRHLWQRERYIARQQESDQPVDEQYLALLDQMHQQHKDRFARPESCEQNLEYDLLTTPWILDKARASDIYAQNLYAAMCNNEFIRREVIPILKNQTWGCSWRYAGGIIADMLQRGDYIDWYCSGMMSHDVSEHEKVDWSPEQHERHVKVYSWYAPEGMITDEIRADLERLGWRVAPGGDWENF